MNKNHFEKDPMPGEVKYIMRIPVSGNKPLASHFKLVEVCKEVYDNSPVRHTMRETKPAHRAPHNPYEKLLEILEIISILESHGNSFDYSISLLVQLSLQISEYISAYENLLPILLEQVKSENEEVKETSENYLKSIPTPKTLSKKQRAINELVSAKKKEALAKKMSADKELEWIKDAENKISNLKRNHLY